MPKNEAKTGWKWQFLDIHYPWDYPWFWEISWKGNSWLERRGIDRQMLIWVHSSYPCKRKPYLFTRTGPRIGQYKHPLSSHPSSQRHLAKQPHIAPHCRHVESAWLWTGSRNGQSVHRDPQMNAYNGHSGAAVWQLCRISRPRIFADEFAND